MQFFTYSKTNYFHFKTLHYTCFPNQSSKTTNIDSLMSVCLCMCVFTCMLRHVYESQRITQKNCFSPSTKWVSGIECWSIRLGDSDLALSHLPSHISPLNRGIQRHHMNKETVVTFSRLHFVYKVCIKCQRLQSVCFDSS